MQNSLGKSGISGETYLMVSDLLKILSAVQHASSTEEKNRLEGVLLSAVEQDIRNLFEDPKFPQRKRSFQSIQGALGIFDEDPQKLKKILYEMGARKRIGRKDYWHLSETSVDLDTARSRNPLLSWSRLLSALGGIAAIVAVLGFFQLDGTIIWDMLTDYSDRQECLEAANGNMRKISKCYKDFP
ncbi:MAG: hypothetical protein ABJ251_06650 [Paracoccaceae bacterium]